MTILAKTLDLPRSGLRAAYAERAGGHDQTVVFLHGAATDHRMWLEHLGLLPAGWRGLAFTQRHHGPSAREASDAPAYGVPTHADDLAAFVRGVGGAPVHLVAWSYAGHVALHCAQRHPELFRSVAIYEPGVPSFLEGAERAAHEQAAQAAFGPIFESIVAGDALAALRQMVDLAGGRRGYFDEQDPGARAIQLENVHTMPLLLLQQEAPPVIDAARLAAIEVPTRVRYGARTPALYSIVGAAAARVLGLADAAVPGEGHMWPVEQPGAFVKDLLPFWKANASSGI